MKKTNDLEKRLQVLEDKFLALEEDIEEDFEDDDGEIPDVIDSEYVESMEEFIGNVRAALEQYDQSNDS